jgi:uncharacterized protein (TIGR04255 family)
MTEPEILAHAPIAEALLDIQVRLPDQAEVENLQNVQSRLGDRFPTKQIRKSWSSQFEFRADAAPVAKAAEGLDGYQFRSLDNKEVIQARMNGFAYSRLNPYIDWEHFSRAAKAAWNDYAAIMKPRSVTRIALRYINRILLPHPADLDEYLTTGPRIASTLPQSITTFFLRAVLQDDASKATVIITETNEEPTRELRLPLILDIDVFRVGMFTCDTEKLWTQFSPLRELKDRVFFESITDATKELLR